MKDWAKLVYATLFLVLAIVTIQFFPKLLWWEYVRLSFIVFCVFATGHFITR